jgi:hypothetical protein
MSIVSIAIRRHCRVIRGVHGVVVSAGVSSASSARALDHEIGLHFGLPRQVGDGRGRDRLILAIKAANRHPTLHRFPDRDILIARCLTKHELRRPVVGDIPIGMPAPTFLIGGQQASCFWRWVNAGHQAVA